MVLASRDLIPTQGIFRAWLHGQPDELDYDFALSVRKNSRDPKHAHHIAWRPYTKTGLADHQSMPTPYQGCGREFPLSESKTKDGYTHYQITYEKKFRRDIYRPADNKREHTAGSLPTSATSMGDHRFLPRNLRGH